MSSHTEWHRFWKLPDNRPRLELCDDVQSLLSDRQRFYVIMLAPAVSVILILMFIRPRKTLALSTCWGRPSIPYPVDLITNFDCRWVYVACCTIMIGIILDFKDQKYIWNPGHWQDPDWVKHFSWIKPFIWVGNVLHVGLIFYPLFACLVLRKTILANILGLVYLYGMMYKKLEQLVTCPKVNGIHNYDLWMELLAACLLHLAYIRDLCLNLLCIYKTWRKQQVFTVTLTSLPVPQGCRDLLLTFISLPHERRTREKNQALGYVRHLLSNQRSRSEVAPTSMVQKVIKYFTYKSIPGFQYPSRIICTLVVSAVCLMSTALKYGEMQVMILEYSVSVSDKDLVTLKWCLYVSNFIGVAMHFIFLAHILVTYRRNMIRKFRGDRSWPFHLAASPAQCMGAGMHYAGFQIAYILWGYVAATSMVAGVSIIVVNFIFIPIFHGISSPVLDFLFMVGPSLGIGIILLYLPVMFSRIGFLQEKGKYMALDNRHLYHVVSYYVFFLNIILGACSITKRSIFSLVFWVMYLCRLDHCMMPRGLEGFDSGFKAYLGMLTVDVYHNHPVMRAFIYLLQDHDNAQFQYSPLHSSDTLNRVTTCRGSYNRRIQNKWWKLVTLARNPELAKYQPKGKTASHDGHYIDCRIQFVDGSGEASVQTALPGRHLGELV